jgi:hypothetical protein
LPLRADPLLRERMTGAVALTGISVTTDPNLPQKERAKATVVITAEKPPVGVGMDVLLRADGREWLVGVVHFRPDAMGTMACAGVVPGFTATHADVVLRPSQAAAGRNVSLSEVWGEPLVFAGREIVWSQPYITLGGPAAPPPPPFAGAATQPATTQPAAVPANDPPTPGGTR